MRRYRRSLKKPFSWIVTPNLSTLLPTILPPNDFCHTGIHGKKLEAGLISSGGMWGDRNWREN